MPARRAELVEGLLASGLPAAFSPSVYGLPHLAYHEHMTTITASTNLENQLYNVYRFILSQPRQDKQADHEQADSLKTEAESEQEG
jgi:hypothetical protein